MALVTALTVVVPPGHVAAQGTQPGERTLAAAPDRPFSAFSRTVLAGRDRLLAAPARDAVVQAARSQVGLRYRLGAEAPGQAFDCSGLVKWVMGLFEINMPRTAAQQATTGIELPKDPARLLPGDLLYFGRGKRITHIGIYVGDGRFVHASNRRVGIVESPVPAPTSTWWRGARRLIPGVLDDLDGLFGQPAPATSPSTPGIRPTLD